MAGHQNEFLPHVHPDLPPYEMAALRFLRRRDGQCAVLYLDPGGDIGVHGASPRADIGAVGAEPETGARAESEYPDCVHEFGAGCVYPGAADRGGGEAAAADAEEGVGDGDVFDGVHVRLRANFHSFFDMADWGFEQCVYRELAERLL